MTSRYAWKTPSIMCLRNSIPHLDVWTLPLMPMIEMKIHSEMDISTTFLKVYVHKLWQLSQKEKPVSISFRINCTHKTSTVIQLHNDGGVLKLLTTWWIYSLTQFCIMRIKHVRYRFKKKETNDDEKPNKSKEDNQSNENPLFSLYFNFLFVFYIKSHLLWLVLF